MAGRMSPNAQEAERLRKARAADAKRNADQLKIQREAQADTSGRRQRKPVSGIIAETTEEKRLFKLGVVRPSAPFNKETRAMLTQQRHDTFLKEQSKRK